MDLLPELYGYAAVVRSVYDADTIRVDIDLGCKVWISNEPIRLYGINAWEIRGDERDKGIAARDYVLGGAWVNLNNCLVVAGHAEVNFYE